MKANETTLIELIGVRKRSFSIPVYQRNYDWKVENCKQLFYDIQNIAKDKRDHFLGTIVYIPDRSTATCPIFIIIDGQQRITSVMLFIKALHDSMDDEDIRADIEEDYLRNSKGGNEYRLKLKPIESDQSVYEKLMMMNDFNEDVFNSDEKETSLYKNYDLFKNLIKESDVSPELLYESVFRLEIVEIQLDKENPQEIFESLNSTGLDLSNADLLRNYLLMSLSYEKQQEMYKRYWLEIERMLGSEYIEDFMTYYLILKKKSDSVQIDGKRAHINPNNLYKSYKLYLSDEIRKEEKSLENLLSDMKKYAGYYKHFVNNDSESDEKAILHREIFTQFSSKAIAIPLMYFYDLMNAKVISQSEYVDALNACISYLFRSRVAGHNVGAQFCALLIQYYERSKCIKFIDRVWEALNSGKGSYVFSCDEDFKNNLQSKDLYLSLRSAGVRYLLYKIEGYLSKEVVTSENATVEHIMPQNLSDQWIQYLNQKNDITFDLYKHRLGNLTLTKENSKLSNNVFADKVKDYEESNYKITRQLVKYKDWTSKEIKQRSIRLSEIATEIWPLPKEYNDEKRESSSFVLSLEDDLELFNGTKPSVVMFCDEIINVNSWTDVYTEIHKRLFDKSEDVYKTYLVLDENKKETILSDNANEYTRMYSLSEEIHLNLSFRNVKRMIRKLQLFVDYFINQTNEAYNIITDEIIIQIA